MTDSLQEKRGIYQCVLNFKDKEGKRRQKWISTGLPVKGNKRKAEKMLNDILAKYSLLDLKESHNNEKFTDYLEKWLERKKGKVEQSTWEDGRPYNPNYITNPFKKHLKKNNFPEMHFHDLRHSCASILYDMNWDLKDIQEWLRHADLETTGDIYTHISEARKKNLAENISNVFCM